MKQDLTGPRCDKEGRKIEMGGKASLMGGEMEYPMVELVSPSGGMSGRAEDEFSTGLEGGAR